MIFNAILSVNHIFIIYTQFYNLLFPHRSCSIGLFSVGKHTPSSQTECSHFAPFVPIMALYGHFTDFDCLRKSRRVSFLRTISVKSGIEPVLLCQSNYTSTSWSTTSAIVLVSALKEQGNPKVCQKIQVYKGYISNIKISKNLHIFHLWKYYYKCCKICEYNTYFWLIKV